MQVPCSMFSFLFLPSAYRLQASRKSPLVIEEGKKALLAWPAENLDAQRRRFHEFVAWHTLILSALEEALALANHNRPFAESTPGILARSHGCTFWLNARDRLRVGRFSLLTLRMQEVVGGGGQTRR